MVPEFDLEEKFTAFRPPRAAKWAMPLICFSSFIISFSVPTVRCVEAPSGRLKVMMTRPSSSVGRKPLGLLRNSRKAPTTMHTRMTTTKRECLMPRCTPLPYFSVTRPNQLLNLKNSLSRPREFSSRLLGFSSSTHRAGVSDKATKAEISTEMAMVMANCW